MDLYMRERKNEKNTNKNYSHFLFFCYFSPGTQPSESLTPRARYFLLYNQGILELKILELKILGPKTS